MLPNTDMPKAVKISLPKPGIGSSTLYIPGKSCIFLFILIYSRPFSKDLPIGVLCVLYAFS